MHHGRLRQDPDTCSNAIAAAKKPNLDRIFAENPMTYIGASGLDVGLPDGQMGNSEVGHATSAPAALCIRSSCA